MQDYDEVQKSGTLDVDGRSAYTLSFFTRRWYGRESATMHRGDLAQARRRLRALGYVRLPGAMECWAVRRSLGG